MVCKKFIDPSFVHEALFVGYLWSQPILYQKHRVHKITESTFTSDLWYFYYHIGKEMFDSGIREFDDKTIYSYLTSKPPEKSKKSYFDCYNDLGGYETVYEVFQECGKDNKNDEYHLSEIQKYECLRKIETDGLINISDGELVDKLCKMTLGQLKMFMQHKVGNVFASVNHGEIVEYNLLDRNLIKQVREKMRKGITMGMPFLDSPRLTKKIKGIKDGTLNYLVLASGIGKTSWSAEQFILSLVKNNQKGLVFANEENVDSFVQLLLATVASTILNKPISREELTKGKFTQDTESILDEAEQWLTKNSPELIKFFEIQKYRMEDVLQKIEILRPQGYRKIFFDTFKPDTSKKEVARWEAFSNNAQELHDVIKESTNNCGTLATVQLKIGKQTRYLDLDCIAKSGEIVEVAAVVMIGRRMFADEYPKEKNALKCYNWKIDELTKEPYQEPFELDKNKKYLIMFIPKNRRGGTDEQIVYEIDYKTNTWKEVCYCVVPQVSGG